MITITNNTQDIVPEVNVHVVPIYNPAQSEDLRACVEGINGSRPATNEGEGRNSTRNGPHEEQATKCWLLHVSDLLRNSLSVEESPIVLVLSDVHWTRIVIVIVVEIVAVVVAGGGRKFVRLLREEFCCCCCCVCVCVSFLGCSVLPFRREQSWAARRRSKSFSGEFAELCPGFEVVVLLFGDWEEAILCRCSVGRYLSG